MLGACEFNTSGSRHFDHMQGSVFHHSTSPRPFLPQIGIMLEAPILIRIALDMFFPAFDLLLNTTNALYEQT